MRSVLLRVHLRVICALALLIAVAAPAAAQQAEVQALATKLAGEISKTSPTRVGVADFLGPGKSHSQLGKILALEFSAALAWSGAAFDVNYTPALRVALREAGATPKNTDIFDDHVVKRLGTLTSADVVVTGILGFAGDHIELSVRVASTATNATLVQASGAISFTPVVKDLLARRLFPIGNPSQVRSGALAGPAFHDGAYEAGRNGITNPVCITCTNPSYTDEARAAGIRGLVILRLIVREDGTPSQISVIRRLGYGLDEAAVRAVSSWRFKPATDASGNPVPAWVTIEHTFTLM